MSSALIRKRFLGHFKSLEKHSRLRSSIILISYVAQILAAIIAGYFLLRVGSLTAYFGTGLISLFIATRFRGINNIVHECSHYTFTQNRPDNVVFGSISAALVLTSFEAYRKEHMTHHANLGDYEKDLDFRNLQDFHLESELTWPTIARHIVTPLVGLHLPLYLRADLSVRDGFGYALLKIAFIFGTIGFAYAYPVAALALIIIPFVWIYPAINYWTDCIDHGGLLESEDDLETSRNLVVPKPLRLIIFPRNDCYHLIHHLFPSVPVQHFDKCHELMLENQAYRSANKSGDQSQSVKKDQTPA
jgi:fatty acid desaturase